MRYALISDIHEDIVHLKLALRKIEKQKCDAIICLGDVSGFSVPHYHYYDTRNASECLRIVRDNCAIIIAGNHDLHAARKVPRINPDYPYPDNWYRMDYHQRLAASREKVWLFDNDELNPLYTHDDVVFLKTLPEYHVLKTPYGNIMLSHYAYPNLTGSMRGFYSSPDEFEAHRSYMAQANCILGFTGHRHYEGLYVATISGILQKRHNRRYAPESMDCIMVPPITHSQIGNGFCIYDIEQKSVITHRI